MKKRLIEIGIILILSLILSVLYTLAIVFRWTIFSYTFTIPDAGMIAIFCLIDLISFCCFHVELKEYKEELRERAKVNGGLRTIIETIIINRGVSSLEEAVRLVSEAMKEGYCTSINNGRTRYEIIWECWCKVVYNKKTKEEILKPK